MNGDTAGFLSFFLLAASLGGWIYGVRAVRLQGRRPLFIASFSGTLVLAVAALAQGAGLFAGSLALFSLLASAVFLGLTAVSGQERKEPAVAVGEPVLHFTAPSEDGSLFDSASLQGRSFLLKFFRGHW